MNIGPGSPSPAMRSDTGSAVVAVLELRPALEDEDEVTGVSANQNTVTFASRTQFHVERLWGQRPFSIVS